MQLTTQVVHQKPLFHVHLSTFVIESLCFLVGFALALLSPEDPAVGITIAGVSAIAATFTS